jgi:tetratricopeptide (TPR) repeat protein
MKNIIFSIIAVSILLQGAQAANKKQAYSKLISEGEAYLRDSQYAQGIETYKQAIEIIPEQSIAHLELAGAYIQSELYGLAEEQYLEVLRIDRKSFDANFLLGSLYLKLMRNADAMEYFQKALTIKSDIQLYKQIAVCARNQGDIELAVAMCKRVISAAPDYDVFVDLGNLYQYQRKKAEAEEAFSQAIKLDQNRSEAYFYIGMLYLENSDFTRAENIFKIVMEKTPDDALVHFFLANIYYQQDKIPSAKSELKLAESLSKSKTLTLYSEKFSDFLSRQ